MIFEKFDGLAISGKIHTPTNLNNLSIFLGAVVRIEIDINLLMSYLTAFCIHN